MESSFRKKMKEVLEKLGRRKRLCKAVAAVLVIALIVTLVRPTLRLTGAANTDGSFEEETLAAENVPAEQNEDAGVSEASAENGEEAAGTEETAAVEESVPADEGESPAESAPVEEKASAEETGAETVPSAAETGTDETTESSEESQPAEEKATEYQVTLADGLVVTMTGPASAFPDGTLTLQVSELTPEHPDYAAASGLLSGETAGAPVVQQRIFDICLLDENGNEVQPADTVKVTFGQILDGSVQGAEIYHLDTMAGSTEKVNVSVDGDNVSMDAEHFSYYGVSVTAETVVTVGDGGDYDSMQKAVDFARKTSAATGQPMTIDVQNDLTESVSIDDRGYAVTPVVKIRMNGHTWTGNNDTALTITYRYNGGSPTVLELEGGTMQAASGYRAIELTKAAHSLTVRNMTLCGNGSGIEKEAAIENLQGYYKGAAGGIVAFSGNTLSMENCVLENGVNTAAGSQTRLYGGAVFVGVRGGSERVKAEFVNCTFRQSSSLNGGAIAVVKGVSSPMPVDLVVKGSEFTGCSAERTGINGGLGGAIYLETNGAVSTAAIEDSRFEGNTAKYTGGALYFDKGNLALTNTDFITNTSAGAGGAIGFSSSTGTITVDGGRMQGNKAGVNGESGGGALCVSNGKECKIRGTVFEGNEAEGSGGALYAGGLSASAEISNVQFLNNTSTKKNGGAADIHEASGAELVTLENITATGNSAGAAGGALYLFVMKGNVTMSGTNTIEGNTAAATGGGIHVAHESGAAKLELRADVTENTAGTDGGGVYVLTTKTTFEAALGGNVSGNKAGRNGGGLYVQSRTIGFDDITVTGNAAGQNGEIGFGGGLYLATQGTTAGIYTFSADTVVYNNQAPTDSKKVTTDDGKSIGASSEIFIRNTKTASGGGMYVANIVADPALEGRTYVDGETTYTLTKASGSWGNKIPLSCHTGYYNTVKAAKKIYLDPSGNSSHGKKADGTQDETVIVTSTLEEAYTVAKREAVKVIYICGTLTVTGEDADQYLNDSEITYSRCGEHPKGYLMEISGAVTFKNVVIDGGNHESNQALVSVGRNAALTIEEGTEIRNGLNKGGYGGGIVVNGSNATATLNMNGGLVTGNSARDGGGIYVQYGTANLEGGTVSHNNATNTGGGIAASHSAVVNIGKNGGLVMITENVSVSEGGGVVYANTSRGEVYRAWFEKNESTLYSTFVSGAAISVHAGAIVKMKNVYATDNYAKHYGDYGALYTCPTGRTAAFEANGALIINNKMHSSLGTTQAPDIYHATANRTDTQSYVSDRAPGGTNTEESKITFYRSHNQIADPTYYQHTTSFFKLTSSVIGGVEDWARQTAERNGVVVIGNIGSGPGSAIANNGSLTIGTEKMAMKVQKVWKDAEGNVTTKHPDQVLVYLTRDGQIVDPSMRTDACVVLNAANGWSYIWRNLDPSAEWSLVEANVPGYTAEVGALVEGAAPEYLALDPNDPESKFYIRTLTNTEDSTRKTGNLTVGKTVYAEDNAGTYSFRVEVANAGDGRYSYYTSDNNVLQPIYSYNEAGNLVLDFTLANGKSLTIVGLPEGAAYTVTEATGDYLVYVNGELAAEGKAQGAITAPAEGTDASVTLAYTNVQKTGLSVEKIWQDGDDAQGWRPNDITLQLLRKTEDTENSQIDSVRLNKENDWKHTFEGLPKYDLDGAEYQYSVSEVTVDGYETAVEDVSADGSFAYTVTNILNTRIHVEKIWNDMDDALGRRPESISVTLKQTDHEGNVIDLETVELNAEGNWAHTFDQKLPMYDEDGNAYIYSVVEDEAIPGGYGVSYGEAEVTRPENGEDAADTNLTLTNTLLSGEAQIVKTLDRYNESLGKAIFVYQVTARSADGELLYSNVLSTEFSESGTQTVYIGRFPVGTTVTVEEVYNGSSYELTGGQRRQTFTIAADEETQTVEMVSAEYVNDYNDEWKPGTGAVNRFDQSEDGNGWTGRRLESQTE